MILLTYERAYGKLKTLTMGYCVNCVYDSIEVSTLDKYEYKIRSEEIKTLIGRKKYTEAMEIADSIDWRKVRSVNMLCTVSDLYKINRRYEESREILLLAYERHPGGRMIIYSLCELSIKLDDVVHAVEYYKEFVQTAPRDNGRYVLQYKLYEAQEVTLEERIAVLEELKRREYREKWAYELAYLYHRIGLGTKCVEECDELVLWFGEGKYVLKALELKMLHAPLNTDQQKKYKKLKGVPAPSAPIPQKIEDDELNIEVKPVNVGEYATINLQKELAESMRKVLGEEQSSGEAQPTIEYTAIGSDLGTDEIRNYMTGADTDEIDVYEEEPGMYEQDPGMYEQQTTIYEPQTQFYEPQTQLYETQTQLYEPEAQVYEPQPTIYEQQPQTHQSQTEELYMDGAGDFTREILTNLLEQPEEEEPEAYEEIKEEVPEAEEVYFEDTDTMEIPSVGEKVVTFPQEILQEPAVVREPVSPQPEMVSPQTEMAISQSLMPSAESMARETTGDFDDILSQEYNGQIRFVMPAKDSIEKQITGQISINDILLEWEKMKKENEEKRAAAVRQRVKEQTGEIFSQFDVSTRQGILAELDAMAEESIEKEKQGALKEAAKPEKAEDSEEDLPEVEELEEIEEKSATQNFTEEEMEAVGKAVAEGEKSGAEQEITAETKDTEAAEETVHTEDSEEPVHAADDVAHAIEAENVENPLNTQEQAEAEEIQKEKAEKSEIKETGEDKEAAEEAGREQKKRTAGEIKEERLEKPQRAMTAEEKKLFGSFIQTKSTKNQIISTLDQISLASYTGNVILTGEPGMGTIKLAKNIIKEIQMTDNNFSGKMAKITGQALNHKDMQKTFDKLDNGALIVEGAGELKETAIKSMTKLLEQENQGIIVILEDTKINMNKLLDTHQILHQNFNLRIDVEALDNDSLVLFGKRYAFEQEYVIDELGVLALYTRIAEMQTSEHSVTMKEVKEIVDEAIFHAGKKNMGHFMDILLGKRYDSDDMIILREKDFV